MHIMIDLYYPAHSCKVRKAQPEKLTTCYNKLDFADVNQNSFLTPYTPSTVAAYIITDRVTAMIPHAITFLVTSHSTGRATYASDEEEERAVGAKLSYSSSSLEL
mmetsp:Transcript_14008/g.19458  ORF Transcript_14008/g.19458 Transcript_14008/m.19458 type:complete len:105 (-) Transcript_14008:1339-1653(-)